MRRVGTASPLALDNAGGGGGDDDDDDGQDADEEDLGNDSSFFLEDPAEREEEEEGTPSWFSIEGLRSPCGSIKSSFDSPPQSPQRGSGPGRDFALNRRYLRDKLSSPERKKPTPAEAKRRLDEKQFMADQNRANLDFERQWRMRQAAERMRDVNERRIARLAVAEQVRGPPASPSTTEASSTI